MKYALIFLLNLISFSGFAQAKVDGIGKFKIGKTTISIIDTLKAELKQKGLYRITTGEGEYTFMTETNRLGQLIADTVDQSKGPSYSSLCPDSKVFFLTNYTIANIKISGIVLTFYHDTLVYLVTRGTQELYDAMTLKYGNGEYSVKETKSECILKEQKKTTVWKNDHIAAYYTVLKYYNSSCDEKFDRFFCLLNTSGVAANDCDAALVAKQRAKIEADKKKKLSDF